MNSDILLKLEELFTLFDQSDEMQRLERLKKQIYQDEALKKLLERYRQCDFPDISLKKEIMNYELVREYRELENQLYYLVLDINQKFRSLKGEKGCSCENN